VLREQATSLIAGARAVIDKWTGSGILFVVTHGANIRALTGIAPASGEIVVVRSGSGGNGGGLQDNEHRTMVGHEPRRDQF
jgi:hypothetical protein